MTPNLFPLVNQVCLLNGAVVLSAGETRRMQVQYGTTNNVGGNIMVMHLN